MTGSQSNKPGGKQPITRHPLFPATVALWFGALFGLGSMAVRPTLLEKAVLAVDLPSIIPASQPPLGATTQILIALASAALGGVIGALLARRIGQPRKIKRVRNRGAASVREDDAQVRQDELDRAVPGQEARAPSMSRRRPLAIREEDGPGALQDPVPLPGQSPRVLDVTEFDLDGFEAELQEPAEEPVCEAEHQPFAAEDSVADYKGETGGGELFQAFEAEGVYEADDELEGDDGTTDEAGEPDQFARPIGSEFVPEEPETRVQDAEQPLTASAGQHPLFTKPQSQPEPWPEYVEADDDSDQDSGDEIFTEPGSAFAPQPAPQLFSKPDASEVDDPEPDVTIRTDIEGEALAGEDDDTENESSDAAPVQEEVRDIFMKVSTSTTVSRIMTAPLSELSQAELLERLATSLASRQGADEPSYVAPAAATDDVAGELPADKAQAEPVTFADAVASDFSSPDPANVAGGPEPDIQADHDGDFSAPPAPAIPAAMRPIVFDDDDDGDIESLPDFVPPRHIAMSMPKEEPAEADEADAPAGEATVEEIAFEPEASPEGSQDETDGFDDAEPESGLECDLEEGYSSLLNLSRSERQQFVRIDEPEADGDEIRPFVVFPGEESGEPAPFARPAATAKSQALDAIAAEVAPPLDPEIDERRFDQPASGVRAESGENQPDPEETERSLRAALATLQRMSGAA